MKIGPSAYHMRHMICPMSYGPIDLAQKVEIGYFLKRFSGEETGNLA